MTNITAFVGNGFNTNNNGKREVSRNVNIEEYQLIRKVNSVT